jgi:predicted porin
MNVRSIAMASALCGCLGVGVTSAQAQSSVTLYGRAVAGADYQNNIANGSGKGRGHLWRHAGN